MSELLPGPLPAGERVLWHGRPDWRAIARDALHVRGLAAYLALLVVSVAVAAAVRGAAAGEVALDAVRAAGIALVPLGFLLAYAWLAARWARYAITNRRIVMRIGVALPMTVNLPFARIASAGLQRRGRTGEIGVTLLARDGLAAIMLWPHAPLFRTNPILRGLHDAERAGQVLAQALSGSVEASGVATVPLAHVPRNVETAAPDRGAQAVAA